MRQKRSQYLPWQLLCILTVLLLCGCSGRQWSWQHPAGLDSHSLQQAEQHCRQLADQEVDRFAYYRPFFDEPYYYGRYYRYRTYGPVYLRDSGYDFIGYERELRRLFRICMRAKGWQRVESSSQQD